jgi:hypothetical protein
MPLVLFQHSSIIFCFHHHKKNQQFRSLFVSDNTVLSFITILPYLILEEKGCTKLTCSMDWYQCVTAWHACDICHLILFHI